MAGTAPLNFDNVDIGTIGFNFEGDNEAIVSECNGSLSVETEVQEIQKKCGATVVASISKPTEMTITLQAHFPLEIFRRIQGIKQMAELKPGVYAYGGNSSGEKFSLSAEIKDLFQGIEKLIAFPKAAINTGLTFEIEAGNDELAYVEIETKAYQDELGNWYYEAIPEEADTVDKVEWLTNFTLDTVKKQSSVPVTDVSLDKTTSSVAVGATDTIKATLTPPNTTDKVTATSKDTTKVKATVSGTTVTVQGVAQTDTAVDVDVKVGTITKTVKVTVTA